MRTCGTRMLGTPTLIVIIAGVLLLLTSSSPRPLLAQTQISLERDKEKTVYTIGSNNQVRQEEAAERDKTWDMLKNMGVVLDQRKRHARSEAGQSGPDR